MSRNRIQTYTGDYYDYLEPRVESIHLDDIAYHLAGTYRFSGAANPRISVAEHSVIVSRLCDNNPKSGLMHDSPEAYLWDIPSPAKPLYGDTYARLTRLCEYVIGEKFGIDTSMFESAEVHKADVDVRNYEGNTVMHQWHEPCYRQKEVEAVIDWKLGLTPDKAERLFRREAIRLGLSPKIDVAPPLPGEQLQLAV